MSQHTVSLQTNLAVFAALLVLLGATVGAAYVDLGVLNVLVAMTIAVCKTALIMLFFMHVRFSNRLVTMFAGAAFLWLAILIALCLSDYLTRGWLGIEGK